MLYIPYIGGVVHTILALALPLPLPLCVCYVMEEAYAGREAMCGWQCKSAQHG